jgi:iron complex transport system substrate-binding protein
MSPVALLEAETIEDISRREVLRRGAMMTLALPLLAACGADDEAGTPEAETRTVHDMFGDVTVAMRPERVVAGDQVTLANTLALGVKPVGTALNRLTLPGYLAGQLHGIADVTGENNRLDLEKAATLEPELILTFGGLATNPFNQENCDRYRQLVATFCYEYGYSTEEEIKKNLTEIARVLGAEERAAGLISDFDKRAAQLRERAAAAGLTDKPVSVVRLVEDGYSVRFGTSESIIFRALGIPRPPNQRDYEEFSLDLSLERVRDIDAHAIYVYVDSDANRQVAPLVENELWKTLEAVRNDRVFFVDGGIWNSADITGAMLIMNDVERTLVAPAENA